MIDISLVSSEVQVSSNGSVYKTYATTVDSSYRFDSRSRLQLTIDGQPYQIPLANLTLNGEAPASEAAALATLSDIFASSAGGGGSASYLVYTALLSQSGTDAPVATVLENTIGAVTTDRSSAGSYSMLSDNLFTANKTIIPPFGDFGGDGGVYLPLQDGADVLGYYTVYFTGIDEITIQVHALNGDLTDLSTLIGVSKIFIEIRVYP